MLQIELSALTAQELKRLLDSARARGQAALAEQLVAELAARPVRAEDWMPTRVGYGADLAFEPADDEVLRPRRSGVMAATAALAALVSAAVTWGLSVPMTPRAQTGEIAETATQPRAAVVLASLAPVGPQPAASPSAPAADKAEPARPPVRLARAAPARSTPGRNSCLDRPTAAERLVCGYPTLAAHDRRLRAAYDKAVASGVDRRELDRAQALWRSQSQHLSDRETLADRYQRRIRELETMPVARSVAREPEPAPPKQASEDPPF